MELTRDHIGVKGIHQYNLTIATRISFKVVGTCVWVCEILCIKKVYSARLVSHKILQTVRFGVYFLKKLYQFIIRKFTN